MPDLLENSENRLLDDSADTDDLQRQLREQEGDFRMQVLNVGVFAAGANLKNYTEVVSNLHANKLVPVTVKAIPTATAADPNQLAQFFVAQAQNNYVFDYAAVTINGRDQLVVLMRAGILPAEPAIPNSPRLPIPKPPVGGTHKVKASSFADPADIAAFRKCKAVGGSDQSCFAKGDNGIGFCGDDCTGPTPMCALPPEDWLGKWGSKQAARLKPVNVTINGKTVQCQMGDTMPHRKNITNGAGIDLSPAAVSAFGLHPPLMIDAEWDWA